MEYAIIAIVVCGFVAFIGYKIANKKPSGGKFEKEPRGNDQQR